MDTDIWLGLRSMVQAGLQQVLDHLYSQGTDLCFP